jgi:hypothetical protein
MVLGMALQPVALGWFAAVADVNTPYVELRPALVLSGIGIGLVFPTVSGEVVGAVRPNQMGIAAGTNTSIRELGGVFGVALAALVFSNPESYTTSAGFVSGFGHALWACAALNVLGAVVTLGGLRLPAAPLVTPQPLEGAA